MIQRRKRKKERKAIGGDRKKFSLLFVITAITQGQGVVEIVRGRISRPQSKGTQNQSSVRIFLPLFNGNKLVGQQHFAGSQLAENGRR